MGRAAQEKRINARVMKWREMLTAGLHSNRQLLVKRTRKGIPPSIRIKVWPELAKVETLVGSIPLTYSKVLLRESNDLYDINLDIPRTFSFQSQEVLRQSLSNVLKALSIQFPQVGYCQGMNFLTMRLLQVIEDEVAFYIISSLIRKYKPIYDNLRNPGFVNRQNAAFSQLFQKHMPKLYEWLRGHMIDPVMYTPAWFLTLFSKSLPDSKFYRFFECFIVEGYPVIFKTALAMMKLKEERFLNNEMQQNLLFINNMEFYSTVSDDDFMSTVFSFQIEEEEVGQLQKQYAMKNKKSVEQMQQSVSRAYKKKMEQPRVVVEWTMQDYRQADSKLVDFQ